MRPVLSVLCLTWLLVSPAVAEPAESSGFDRTLDEVAALIDAGDEASLTEAKKLIKALREKADEAEQPRIDAYASRLLLAKGEYVDAWTMIEPHVEDREKLDPSRTDCYFSAGLIRQAMAYRESPESNDDQRVTFMGMDVAIEKPTDDDPPLIGEGLGYAIESLNLFSLIASSTPAPTRLDALDQAGRTLIIMHEWQQARQAYQMALDQTRKAPVESITDEQRKQRVARYQRQIERLDAVIDG